MEVLPDRLSSLVLASYWEERRFKGSIPTLRSTENLCRVHWKQSCFWTWARGAFSLKLKCRWGSSPRRCSPDQRTCRTRWPLRWRTSAWLHSTRTPEPTPQLFSCWEVWKKHETTRQNCTDNFTVLNWEQNTESVYEREYLSPIGWILEMVTSSLGSSFSRAQDVVKEEPPPSVSHRDPKLSPTVNGLSLYLKHQPQQI